MVDQAMGIEKKYCLSDVVWTRVMALLPAHRKRRKGGRPPMDGKRVANPTPVGSGLGGAERG